LHRVTLDIDAGAITGVLGPNGAGKTTLLTLVMGLRCPSSGTLTVLGTRLPANDSGLRRRIGVVLQNTALYEDLTTFENLRFAASLYQLPDPRQRIAEVLDLLGLTDRANSIVSTHTSPVKVDKVGQ
jgi:ABC-2 type transport system ATP-binding protein